jgi:Protein of unknown function (DUF1826)
MRVPIDPSSQVTDQEARRSLRLGPRRGATPQGESSAASPAGSDVESLARLHRDEVSLVSWHRVLPAGLGEQLLEWAERFPARFEQTVAMPGCDLTDATRGLADPARAWLTMDTSLLLARFALVAGARRLRVWFGAVRTDQCRKFHVDYLRYRLVTTYVGPGTEWVSDDDVRREALDHPPECPCDANKEIVRDLSRIRQAVPGEVLVMKGARHPNGRGVVHRSPPIEGTGRVRVVLIASTVDAS